MASTTNAPERICTQCGSHLTRLEWEERLDPHQLRKLWKCIDCNNEFTTLDADEESVTDAEIVTPFFTNLVVE
ncbi:MAG: hypothetical protein J0H38_18300 [Rhizobiales bacterium]|nr:hypothetical protein [Hyphomicrobiales bacterium]